MPSPYVARCAGAPYALGAYVLSRLCTESAYVPSSYVAAYGAGAAYVLSRLDLSYVLISIPIELPMC